MNPLETPSQHAWKKVKVRPHHGIVVPLASLHSADSSGIGEFYDLIPLASFCKKVGFDLIQLLPLNDTRKEPSPYSATSSCALHPIYLSLHKLPYLDKQIELKKKLKTFAKENRSKTVLFSAVYEKKIAFLRDYFDKCYPLFTKDKAYKAFIKNNPWVKSYALFSIFKDLFRDSSWESWPSPNKNIASEKLTSLLYKNKEKTAFYLLLQYLCFSQLKSVSQQCKKKGVLLMGDIPNFLSKESADVWEKPSSFDLTLYAGAPPDAYEKEGQCWQFPLYHWDKIKREHYQFWKNRLHYAENFYSLFRIDHVVGLFRVWAIPPGKTPKEGFYIPSTEPAWKALGETTLSEMIASTSMLPVGEDLGQVPPLVRETLKEKGICGTKVMRWERYWDTDGSYIDPKDYPLLSYATVSTHDSSLLSEWWEKNAEEAKLFAQSRNWKYVPKLTNERRMQILKSCHSAKSLFHVNLLQEYLAFIPQYIAKDPANDRINIPGTISERNWTYRFIPSVEKLLKSALLQKKMKSLLD